LALRLDTQMRPAFLEGGFHTPTLHEIAHDLPSRLRLVGGPALWAVLSPGASEPSESARSRPSDTNTRSCTQLQRPFTSPYQLGRGAAHGLRILQDVVE
jgi:hypothetical protein